MADGKVVIDVILEDGTTAKGIADLNKLLGGVGKTGEKASLSIGKIASALGLVYVAKKGIDMVRNSLDGAIDRYDTLNQFPRVLQMLGFDAEDSDAAIQKLSDGIDGLPTTLDSVANTAQNIAVMTGDLDGAVDTTLALNNAFMASGSSSEDAKRGLEQYVQMLSKGEVDLQSWRTLQETMGVALNKLAEEFGFTGESAQNDLYDALKEGEITFDEFNAKLIEASNAQGGFADMAKEASGGIKTSWTNVKTSVVKGVADVIEAIDKALGGVGSIENMLDGAKAGVKTVFAEIVKRVPAIVATVQTVVEIVKNVYNALEPWLPLIGAIALGITAAVKGFETFYAIKSMIDTIKIAVAALNTTILANPWFWVAAAVVAAVVLIYVYWEPISEFFVALWGKIKEVSIAVWDGIKDAWKVSVEYLKNAWNGIAEFFSNLWSTIADIFTDFYEPVMSVLNEVIGYFKEKWQEIAEFFTELWDDIFQTMAEVWDLVRPYWLAAVELLIDLWQTFVETFTSVWESIVQIVMTYWEAITNTVEIGLQMTKEVISAGWEFVKSITMLAFEIIKAYILTVWNVIMIGIRTTQDIIKTVIQTAWDIIKTLIDTAMTVIKTVIETMWNIIKGIIQTTLKLLQGDVKGAWEAIKNTIDSVLSGIRTIISTIWNAILSIIGSVLSGISSIISSIWDGISSTISRVVNSIKDTISNTFNSLKGIVSEAFSSVKSAVSDGIEAALQVVTDIASKFFDAGKNIVTSIADGITSAVSKVTDAIGDVTEKVRGFLPFSPAKYGALRDIMDVKWGESIGGGIEKAQGKVEKSTGKLTQSIADQLNPGLSALDGISANSFIGDLSLSTTGSVTGGVKSSEATGYDDTSVVKLLKAIANKDLRVYIDGNDVTRVVNTNNAISAEFNKF